MKNRLPKGWKPGQRCLVYGLALMAASIGQGASAVQSTEPRQPDWLAGLPEIAATVDGQPVSARRVIQHLERTVPHFRQFDRSATERLLGEALDHLIRREVVLCQLLAARDAPGQSAVRLERTRLEAELAARGETLSAHIGRTGLSEGEFDRELLWKLAWQQRLDAELTDDAVTAWFDKHHYQFDGATLRVDQILWLWPDPRDAAAEARIREEAADVADRLRRNQLQWDTAVQQWSMSPLAKLPERTDMGWIGYHGPMPEAFAAAAFALRPGEVSLPVETRAGLHIIKSLELRRGERTLPEAAAEVRASMSEELFGQLAEGLSGDVSIVRTPGFPNPGSSPDGPDDGD
jgi:PPIC-type PPIASE domain